MGQCPEEMEYKNFYRQDAKINNIHRQDAKNAKEIKSKHQSF
jgi:hypothetical protein